MPFNIHSAKLDRELIRAFAKKELNITKTAISLIFHLTPLIDRDGKIHMNENKIRRDMVCDRRSFYKVLNELLETTYNGKKLMTFENGYYVSHFHLPTNGKVSYLRSLPIFTSPKFMNLTLNQTRLFLYIATLNVQNQYKAVAIENLYMNKLHDEILGMCIYHNPQDMREDLFHLIDNGIILVRLQGEKKSIDENYDNYKEVFNKVCGFKSDRKKRTSKYHKDTHVFGLKINSELYKEKEIRNEPGKAELELLCDRYHMFHEDMKPETFNYIVGRKNDMMEQFGEAGLAIYRIALEKYFKEKNENIVYYDIDYKAANHFTDFYLLEEIKKVILAALKFETGSRGDFAATGFSEVHIPLLIKYFVAESSDEHKVLIEEDIQLIKKADELMNGSGSGTNQTWLDLADSIKAAFVKHTPRVETFIFEECSKNGISDFEALGLLREVDTKELIISLAKKSLLSKQKEMDEEAKKLKQIIRFFRKKKIPILLKFTPRPEKEKSVVPFTGYSWLTEGISETK